MKFVFSIIQHWLIFSVGGLPFPVGVLFGKNPPKGPVSLESWTNGFLDTDSVSRLVIPILVQNHKFIFSVYSETPTTKNFMLPSYYFQPLRAAPTTCLSDNYLSLNFFYPLFIILFSSYTKSSIYEHTDSVKKFRSFRSDTSMHYIRSTESS